ncbi:MAG: helix-turn-helix domain-containing protein [Dysosmobacter sp.]
MATEFSRTLSLLRKERGVSQRVAAADLGVSQALLSHYENGIREPGLAFVSKVCDYYHVSADYMLGRTLARDGSMLTAEEILNAAEPGNVLQGSVLATLRGKLITSASGVLFGLLGTAGRQGCYQRRGGRSGLPHLPALPVAPPGRRRAAPPILLCPRRTALRAHRLRRGLSGPDGLRPCAGETVP